MKPSRFWRAHGDLVHKALAVLASYASLASLLLVLRPEPSTWPLWAKFVLAFAGFTFVYFAFLEYITRRKHHAYDLSDQKAIRSYMHKWIEHGGRVAIWTRDLSWASDNDTRELLLSKARSGELILCLPEVNDIAKQLSDAGAELCAYGRNLLESPSSRFTIAFYGRDGSRVAVGRAERDLHVIEEFRAGEHPAFHLCEDLVDFARAACSKQP